MKEKNKTYASWEGYLIYLKDNQMLQSSSTYESYLKQLKRKKKK